MPGLWVLLALVGCEEKPEGPKRADDKAAHSVRYHPDVTRGTVTGSRPAEAQATGQIAPTATRFADLLEAGVIGSPVLFVNNQTVTIPEVLEPIIDDLQRESRILPERDYIESVRQKIREQIDYRISTILVYEQAKSKYSDQKIQELIDKRVDDTIKGIVNAGYGGVYARYEAHLKSIDYTLDEQKERIKREAIVREYLKDRFRPMLKEPRRSELMRHYEQHVADFTTPEKAELFLIEVPLKNEAGKPLEQPSADELAAARQRARERVERAHEEIESGVDFATVARAYSEGAMKSQGGAWGTITRGALTKRWARPAEVLFTLEPGQMTIVEAEEAVFLVRCGQKTPAHCASFEEAQKEIIDKILEDEFSRLRTDYIVDLIKRSTINKRPEFTRALLAVIPQPPRPAEASAGSTFDPGG